MADKNIAQAVGRRKCAVARVYMRNGKGAITVNGIPANDFFRNDLLMYMVNQPLECTKTSGKFDFVITVRGGGLSGQAGAVRLGIARALVENDSQLKDALHKEGFLTRDSRMVERKKYGQKGARKRFQFSKR